jgi:DNA-directed RNA polymerase specialized sigma subunit, sigma24 homolog
MQRCRYTEKKKVSSLMPPRQSEDTGLPNLTDELLIDLIVQRDEAALGELYDRYASLVYAIALRITGDRQTAEEVMQDVFQNIWQTAGGFRHQSGAVVGWIIGITRHRAIDTLRSKRERARNRELTGIEAAYFLPNSSVLNKTWSSELYGKQSRQPWLTCHQLTSAIEMGLLWWYDPDRDR